MIILKNTTVSQIQTIFLIVLRRDVYLHVFYVTWQPSVCLLYKKNLVIFLLLRECGSFPMVVEQSLQVRAEPGQ